MDNKDFKIVYNPKFIENAGLDQHEAILNTAVVTDIYAARRNGKEDQPIVEKSQQYTIKPGQILKFRSDVADYFLKKYKFLEHVPLKNLEQKIEEMKKHPAYKCEYCDETFEVKVGLIGHRKSHKLSPEAQAVLDTIPDSLPEAYNTPFERSAPSIDEQEGTQDGVDKDGVEFYGGGLTTERSNAGMRNRRRSSSQI